MINKYTKSSINHKDICFDKEYNRYLDIVELVRTANSLNNQLIEANIRLKHVEEENKRLKQQIKEVEFRSIIK